MVVVCQVSKYLDIKVGDRGRHFASKDVMVQFKSTLLSSQ